jgi:DNA-binding NarL/FixJ family response regulator
VVRILIADDHEVIRLSLRSLIASRDGWQLCGEARNGREAVELAKALRPDIVVLDLSMPELNGLEATLQIRKALPKTEVLVFTMHDTDELVHQVIAAGARGYLLKSDAMALIEPAIDALAQHKPYFAPVVTQVMLDAVTSSDRSPSRRELDQEALTQREREIVQLLAEGKSNKMIATSLDLSVTTVQTHRAAIMRKLNVRSIAELVRYAVRNKIIDA